MKTLLLQLLKQTLFEMKNLEGRPCEKFFPKELESLSSSQMKSILMLAVKQLVDNFVDISVPKIDEDAVKSTENAKSTTTPADHDGKFAYACDLLSNGLLLLELIDGVREGDGERIIRVWQ